MPNVHKDFHGALSYGLQFVHDNCGEEAAHEFLAGLAETVYQPLVEDMRRRGLAALRDHWQRVFDLEGGEIELAGSGDSLELRVIQCPAIAHMREHNYAIADRFCEHCRIVNGAICGAAGFDAGVEYDQKAGRCVQRFWKAAE